MKLIGATVIFCEEISETNKLFLARGVGGFNGIGAPVKLTGAAFIFSGFLNIVFILLILFFVF